MLAPFTLIKHFFVDCITNIKVIAIPLSHQSSAAEKGCQKKKRVTPYDRLRNKVTHFYFA
jgi:hypothetical protein